jgi:FkbM family methyltransferase
MLISIYLKIRKRLRNLVIKYHFSNKYILSIILGIDIFLRKLGILNSFKKRGILNINGFIINFGEQDYGIAETLITNNDYEYETREIIGKILLPDSIFLDLGANIGLHSIFATKYLTGMGKVYSFEPTPNTFNYLVENIKINNLTEKIIPENIAITYQNGYAYFLVTKNSECNSIVTELNDDVSTIKVPTMSIDNYCKSNNINKVDLIKMDIEGQELNAMKSMIDTVKNNESIKIIFELHENNLKNNNEEPYTILSYLNSMGLKYFMLINNNPIFFNVDDDLIFLHKELKIYNVNILASKTPLN